MWTFLYKSVYLKSYCHTCPICIVGWASDLDKQPPHAIALHDWRWLYDSFSSWNSSFPPPFESIDGLYTTTFQSIHRTLTPTKLHSQIRSWRNIFFFSRGILHALSFHFTFNLCTFNFCIGWTDWFFSCSGTIIGFLLPPFTDRPEYNTLFKHSTSTIGKRKARPRLRVDGHVVVTPRIHRLCLLSTERTLRARSFNLFSVRVGIAESI